MKLKKWVELQKIDEKAMDRMLKRAYPSLIKKNDDG
jgi:hypothetical protein